MQKTVNFEPVEQGFPPHDQRLFCEHCYSGRPVPHTDGEIITAGVRKIAVRTGVDRC
jgi:hypothetical protein